MSSDEEREADRYLRLNNLAIQGKPEDITLTTHVCRKNRSPRPLLK